MARRYKRLNCGEYVREVLYSCPEPRDTPVVRRERSKLTSEAQKRVNQENSKVKLAMLIGGNFGPGDLLVTPTFAPDHYPATYSEFQKKCRNFLAFYAQSGRDRATKHDTSMPRTTLRKFGGIAMRL